MSVRYNIGADGTVSGVEEATPLPPREREVPRDARYYAGLEALKRKRDAVAEAKKERVEAALQSARESGPAVDHLNLIFVPIYKIRRESLFNRDLDHDRALEYAMDFQWEKFGSVSLNLWSDGTYECIDGQHRIVAAELVHGPECEVPAAVSALGHISQVAAVYDAMNTSRVGLTFQAKLRGRLVAGFAEAQQLVNLLEEFGLTPAISNAEIHSPAPGMVVALSKLNQIRVRGGASAVREVLGMIKEAHGETPEAYRDYMLEGLFVLLLRYHDDPNWRRERVVKTLQRGLGKISERAKRFQSGMETKRATLWAQALHSFYNEDLNSHRQLSPWQSVNAGAWGRLSHRASRLWREAHESTKELLEESK